MRGSLLVKMNKKQKLGRSRRVRKDERDRLSQLPNCVLLHMMQFMDTKDVVRTSVLSKRWKDLWKLHNTLYFHSSYFKGAYSFINSMSRVLLSRDSSNSLHSLDFILCRQTELVHFNRIMECVALHNVKRLSIDISLDFVFDFEFHPFDFFCQSLPFVQQLCISVSASTVKLPKSLQFPPLEKLHLKNFAFSVSHNKECAAPFSACKLHTLVLENCSLHGDAKVLHISNSSLSCLKLHSSCEFGLGYKIVLSTPNLSSFTAMNTFGYHQLSSKCNLPSLEELNIDSTFKTCSQPLIRWLSLFVNVKKITFCPRTVKFILDDLSNHHSMRIQLPCFYRLESLKVKVGQFTEVSDEEVNMVAEFLLQKSPLAKVNDIVHHSLSHPEKRKVTSPRPKRKTQIPARLKDFYLDKKKNESKKDFYC